MKRRPHVLILMTDQQRADSLGCAGHPQLKTPNMDRLAREGLRFRQATTVCPICMPARASFISGLYPHNHGIWENSGELSRNDETLFHHLQRSGYFTAHIGKAHYYEHTPGHLKTREDYMQARGFDYVHETTGMWATAWTDSYMTDEWKGKGQYEAFKRDYEERAKQRIVTWPSSLPAENYFDGYVGRKSVEFIESYDDSRPLCLFAGFPGPHEPWDAPGEYAAMYDPEKSPRPIPRPETPAAVKERPDFMPTDRIFDNHKRMTAEDIQKIQASYYGKISLIDHWVGEILNAFESRRDLENLMVVFWSDHGEMLGDHNRLYKSTFHESGIRVPLILRWPGEIPAGSTSDALAEIIDIFPTVLEAAGAEPSSRCQGKSLLPLVKSGSGDHRAEALSEILYGGTRNIMIRDRRYKYALDEEGRGFMLYDLEADPEEQNNLIAQPAMAGLEAELKDRLYRRLLKSQVVLGQDGGRKYNM